MPIVIATECLFFLQERSIAKARKPVTVHPSLSETLIETPRTP